MHNSSPVGRDEIRDTVIEVLRDILGAPDADISGEDRLVEDLEIISDDLTFSFALELEERLRVKIPPKDWKDIYKVEDAVSLLSKHCSAKEQGRQRGLTGNQVAAVSSSAPAPLLARYFRKLEGVSVVDLCGAADDWWIDFTLRGKTYHVDRQLGDVQFFAPEGVEKGEIDQIVMIAENLPKTFWMALIMVLRPRLR